MQNELSLRMEMEQIQMDWSTLKESLMDAIGHLEGYIDYLIEDDTQDASTLHRQLFAVNESVQALEKQNIPIPDELRNLKLKLAQQVSSTKDHEQIKRIVAGKLINILDKISLQHPSTKPSSQEKKSIHNYPSRQTTYNIKLQDVIQAGLIAPGTKIFHDERTGRVYHAIIRPFGRVEVFNDGKSKIVDSLSTAVRQLTGQSRNEWDWWFVRLEDGKEVPMSFLREQLRKENRL